MDRDQVIEFTEEGFAVAMNALTDLPQEEWAALLAMVIFNF